MAKRKRRRKVKGTVEVRSRGREKIRESEYLNGGADWRKEGVREKREKRRMTLFSLSANPGKGCECRGINYLYTQVGRGGSSISPL